MMQQPGSKEIITAMLRAASGSGISDESLRSAVTFECSVYAAASGRPTREQVQEFQREVIRIQDHLIQTGLIARPAANLCATTPLGEAHLAAGCAELDTATLQRLKAATPLAGASSNDAQPSQELKDLLDQSELHYEPMPGNVYNITFNGKLRSWCVRVWAINGWFCMRTHVMRVPESALGRSSLFEAALRANEQTAAAKICAGRDGSLYIDSEYRFKHVDVPTLQALIAHVASTGDMVYPRLFQAATSEESLQSLEAAFKRSTDKRDD